MQTYRSVTNKKIAILYSQDPDGDEVGGALWPKDAKAFGYQVVTSGSFPDSATNFAAAVGQAKSSGAQIVLVDCDTPQAIAIRQQMAASNYAPKVLDIEVILEPFGYSAALKDLASGDTGRRVLVADPSFPRRGCARGCLSEGVDGTVPTVSAHRRQLHAAAQVPLQAIARAGGTSNTAINSAIGQTNGMFVVGRINFAGSTLAHAAAAGRRRVAVAER